MNAYIANAACRGIRPAGLPVDSSQPRRYLIARMLKRQDVPRILRAPAGFGKTTLADQYAQLVFSYWHVFWFDCQDLRFIRGLVQSMLFHDVLQRDAEAALVVFDDVPLLSDEQAKCFVEGVALLIDAGCEVLITCTPVAANSLVFEGFCAEDGAPLELNARALLAQSSELQGCKEGCPLGETAFSRNVLSKIPQLAWGEEDNVQALVQGFSFDELPWEQTVLGLVLFSLGAGCLSDVQPLFGTETRNCLVELSADYPYFSFDAQAETFEALACADDVFQQTVLPLMEEVLSLQDFQDRQALAAAYIQALLDVSKGDRACAAVCELMPYAQREAWLLQRGLTLIFQGSGGAFEQAASALAQFGRERPFMKALREMQAAISGKGLHVSVCTQMLEQEREPLEARCLFGALLLRCDECAVYRDGLEGRLWTLYDEAGACAEESLAAELFRFAFELRSSFAHARDCWAKRAAAVAPFDVATMVEALWLAETHLATASLLGRELVVSYLKRVMDEENRTFPLLREGARKALVLFSPANAAQIPSRIEYQALSIPPLRITFWGTFEVSLGTRVVDAHCFSRRKSLTLLALLAAQAGHDVSRDRLVEMLWPESTLNQGRHNLHVIWADLRRGLKLSDGTCPYLIRTGLGYRINMAFASCDVVEVRQIMRTMQGRKRSSADLAAALDRLVNRFGGDPIPNDYSNEEINRFRRSYCTEVVDSLVAAANDLCQRNEWQLALRFAREAVARGRDREDAYVVEMRAQMALGQRTSALNTYFACQRFLSEHLGIDPSTRITALYEQALEDEAPLPA